MSLGKLTEEFVQDIRLGRVTNPPVEQISALAEVFAVHPSYFLDSGEASLILDEEVLTALTDETTRAIILKVMSLSQTERTTILGIVQQFGRDMERGGCS